MIKNLLKVLFVVAVILALAFVGIVYLVNPNQYRSAIEQAVLDSTGYELLIAGNLDLQFSPYFGLTLSDVRLRNPALPQELASTTEVALRVDPRQLLQGELVISEFRADDFHVNYYTDASARNNWDVSVLAPDATASSNPASSATTPATTSPTARNNRTIRASFERILVNNASIDIQDLSAGTRYNISNLNLESRNANLEGQTFPVELDFVFLNNGISEPLPMGLRISVAFNQSAGTLQLNDINFNLTPVLLRGQIGVSGLNDSPRYDGNLETNQFALSDLLQTLNSADSTSDVPAVSTQPPIAFTLAFSGDLEQISIPTATLTIADTLMQASADVRLATEFEPISISYEVNSNGLDLTPFLASTEPEPEAVLTEAAVPDAVATNQDSVSTPAAATVATSVPSPLPLEMLNSFNLLGSVSLESITVNSMVFNDIIIFTNLEDGVLDVESQPIAAFEGTLLGNMRMDARGGMGNLTTQIVVNQLNVGTITPIISRLNSVAGRLNVMAEYTAQGTTTNELFNSLTGSTQFSITENAVDIGVIKQVFTAISALSTTGEAIQQWPDEISFQELSGYILLENGITENQQVKLRMDNFDVTGTGGLDFSAETFDYDLLFTVLGEPFVQTIQISPRYHDISWPVRCGSAFDDNVTQYCRPDFAQVRQIFTQMGTNEVRRRLDDVVNDQLPAPLQDTARGLLRNFLN